MDVLAAIPEPDGVTLYRVPPSPVSREAGELTVEVAYLTGTSGLDGTSWQNPVPVPVPLDLAHDLSWQGPRAYVWPEAGDIRGVTRWRIDVLGFIRQEAEDAFAAVTEAVWQMTGG
jgi:hypothetical protein